jgi:hypothetical protein
MSSKYSYKIESKDPEFLIQLPKTLLQDLQKKAKDNGHLLSTEIVIRLIRTLESQDIEGLENNVLNLMFD